MNEISRLLIEQRIKEYDMRLRHVDELLEHAERKLPPPLADAETRELLGDIKNERDKLAGWLEKTRHMPLKNWREDEIRAAGPMGIWDAIAQQVERLVERMER